MVHLAVSRLLRPRSFAVAAVLALTLVPAAPLAPALADEDGRWSQLARFLDESGLTLRELGNPTFMRVDLATGESVTEELTWAEAFEAMGDVIPEATTGAADRRVAHAVAGGVYHNCADATRKCYFFNRTFDPATSAELARQYNATAASYASAASGAPAPANAFPLRGGDVFRVKGKYFVGTHVADDATPDPAASPMVRGASVDAGYRVDPNRPDATTAFAGPGEGRGHGDRSIIGHGVGTVYFTFRMWGADNYISFGRLTAHGAFVFCQDEDSTECHVQG